MSKVNTNYILNDTVFGPSITWGDCEQTGVALDEFQSCRQILVYDENLESDEPVVIVRFNRQNKIVEVQIFRDDVLVLKQFEQSAWCGEQKA